jgi:hypothetical protein
MALSQVERRNLGEQVYKLHILRHSYTEIGERLGITRQFASVLAREEAALRERDRRTDEREKAIATYEATIRSAWEWLARIQNPSTNNLSALLNTIVAAQSRIDEITGIRAPKQVEGYLRHAHQYIDVDALSGEVVAQLERELLENDGS